MTLNIREIVKVAYASASISPDIHPSAEEIATMAECIRETTGVCLSYVEIEILLIAEQIADRHK